MPISIKEVSSPKMKSPIFIEGLPGIGNVGKVCADFLIEEMKAEKMLDIYSDSFPNYVFVEQNNLVKLPRISIHHKKVGTQDFMFMTGDVQPTDEGASYIITEKILDILEKYGVSRIITMGGIGLNDIPKTPKVFCTGNSGDFVNEFKAIKVSDNLYGVVGPIIGVTGLLLGLSARRKIKSVSLLAETYNHPMYIGLNSARSILQVLSKKYGFKFSFSQLNKEIKELQSEIDAVEGLDDESVRSSKYKKPDTYYIG